MSVPTASLRSIGKSLPLIPQFPHFAHVFFHPIGTERMDMGEGMEAKCMAGILHFVGQTC